jgi:hypothetical protein
VEPMATRKSETENDRNGIYHTTIALQKDTKSRLDGNKAPGQCYDGFISELIDYWVRYRIGSSLCGPGKPLKQSIGSK